jgi:hypothetical protein
VSLKLLSSLLLLKFYFSFAAFANTTTTTWKEIAAHAFCDTLSLWSLFFFFIWISHEHCDTFINEPHSS